MPYKTATHGALQQRFLKPQEWTGHEVYDPVGQKIGRAEETLVNSSDDPEYIRVRMGFLGPKTVLIPISLAAADIERRAIELRYMLARGGRLRHGCFVYRSCEYSERRPPWQLCFQRETRRHLSRHYELGDRALATFAQHRGGAT